MEALYWIAGYVAVLLVLGLVIGRAIRGRSKPPDPANPFVPPEEFYRRTSSGTESERKR